MGDFEVERYEHAGLTVVIEQEQYVEDFYNPRKDDDCNLGTMLCSHRNYELGDEQVSGDDFEPLIRCDHCGGNGEEPGRFQLMDRLGAIVGAGALEAMESELTMGDKPGYWVGPKTCIKCEGDGEIRTDIITYLKVERKAICIMPLFLYDHSGISMSVGGRIDKGEDDFSRSGRIASDSYGWDVSSVGVIFTTQERVDELGAPQEKIEEQLEQEVKTYDSYLRGEVYWYHVDDENDDVLDSCGGFLGDTEYVKEEANRAAEGERHAIEKEDIERGAMAARDIVTEEGQV
jgi:hypothetical protein